MWAIGRALGSREGYARWHHLRLQVALLSKSSKGAAAGSKVKDSDYEQLARALERQPVKPLNLTPEELQEAAEIAKEYSRKKMRQHRAWQKDLTTKLKLKLAAIDALPDDLRAAAREPDMEPFPLTRRMWTETPPKEEDKGSLAADMMASQGKRKGRKMPMGTKEM